MRRRLAAAAIITALLAAAGCGNGDEPGEGGPDLVRIGLIPIVDVAPLYLGEDQGFFEDRNIELEIDFAAGGADIVPSVQSGQYHFGFSNVISMMLAHNAGLDVKVVVNGNNSTGVAGEDFGSLLVPVDSPVQRPAELAGAVVASNTPNNIVETIVRASVRNDGGDPADVEFTGVPFPEMEAALANGDVAAAFAVEPFQTLIRENGVGRSIAWSWVDAAPELTVAVYFTTGERAVDDADLVARFTAAMQESLAYANENPDAVREIIPSYTSIEPELAAQLTLPTWPPEINRASAERLAELALQDGLLTEEPDLDALFP